MDEALVEALKRDFRSAPLDERDRVMLAYVEQLTRDATRIGPDHHERLRAVGFDDRAILQVTLIASWFNYINRVADALGVGRDGGQEPHRGSR
ncbi:MAG: carboxymuconolactone decarboxylase family protein [Vicinamibacteraceae bacterium]